MTQNSLKQQELDLKKEDLKETKRSNKAKEGLEKRKQNLGLIPGLSFGKAFSFKPNDPSWYTNDDPLVRDTANLAMEQTLGVPVQEVTTNGTVNLRTPGIATIYFNPTLGHTVDNDDVVTIAARNIYTWVRHANSGHANYDAPDLMMYILAIDSVYAYIAEAIRYYGACMREDRFNKYGTIGLRTALGLGRDTMVSNLADFRAAINSAILKVGSLVVPAELSFIKRHSWLNSHVFKDVNIAKSQFYAYIQNGFYKYNEVENRLEYDCTANMKARFTDPATWISQFNKIADPILASESFQIMSGDILKAYGEGSLVQLSAIDPSYKLEPQFDNEALNQLKNITLVGSDNDITFIATNHDGETTNLSQYSIRQKTSGHIYTGYDESENNTNTFGLLRISDPVNNTRMNTSTQVLTIDKDTISSDEALVYTRGMVTLKYDSVSSHYYITSNGTEVFLYANIYMFTEAVPGHLTMGSQIVYNGLKYVAGNSGVDYTVNSIYWFDWFPRIKMSIATSTAATAGYTALDIYEFQNFRVMEERTISNLHKTAIYSEYHVKQMGRSR